MSGDCPGRLFGLAPSPYSQRQLHSEWSHSQGCPTLSPQLARSHRKHEKIRTSENKTDTESSPATEEDEDGGVGGGYIINVRSTCLS